MSSVFEQFVRLFHDSDVTGSYSFTEKEVVGEASWIREDWEKDFFRAQSLPRFGGLMLQWQNSTDKEKNQLAKLFGQLCRQHNIRWIPTSNQEGASPTNEAKMVEPEEAKVVEPEEAKVVELEEAKVVEPEEAKVVEPEEAKMDQEEAKMDPSNDNLPTTSVGLRDLGRTIAL